MNGICFDFTPILGRSAGYHEKPSHNRIVDSTLGLKAYCPKIDLIALTKA